MKLLRPCEVCGEGHLHPQTARDVASHGGQIQHVVRHFHVCDMCKGHYALPEDLRENKREVLRFQKGVDAIPMGCEIREMRVAAGLSQVEAGELFGGGPTAFSKYESDDLVPNEAMVNLLKLAIADLGLVGKLRALKGVHVRASASGVIAEAQVASDWHRVGEAFVEAEAAYDNSAVVMPSGSYGSGARWTQ